MTSVARSVPFEEHPGWCDPRYCQPSPDGVLHVSTPTSYATGDESWQFRLHRFDEHAHPGEVGATELRIDVIDTLFTAPDVQHVLRMDDIERLVERISTERLRARLQGAPVVHRAVA